MATQELTKREQETVDIIKKAGAKGIGFETLMERLGIKAPATMRGRISTLMRKEAIRSEKDGKFATYFVS